MNKASPHSSALRDPINELALAAAFFLPLKLSFAYGAFIAMILLWGYRNYRRIPELVRAAGTPLIAYMLFAVVVVLCEPFGINPLRSIGRSANFPFMILGLIALSDRVRALGALPFFIALASGQAFSATHSVLNYAFEYAPREVFIGKVAQSGQIALTFFCALGAAFALSVPDSKGPLRARAVSAPIADCAWGALNFALLGFLGFAPSLGFARAVQIFALIALSASVVLCGISCVRGGGARRFLFAIVLPLISAVLLLNLKRGPWLGVFAGAIVFLGLYSRRFLMPLLALILLAVTLITPIRERLSASSQHFFISGGRNVIWQIGGDLALKYPLGIGYENSPFLRKFDPMIPPQLVHFHNNLLNITVECGWLAVCVFVWWIVVLLRTAFERLGASRESILAAAAGCAVLSWQAAGIVEYNYGDSEVLLVALVVIAALIGIRRPAGAARTIPLENARDRGAPTLSAVS